MITHGVVCGCGCIQYEFFFAFFPIRWTATCQGCGVVTRCGIKLDKPKPKPPPKPRYGLDYGPWF
jgi:hypothetical protein